jgi:hypothetical protein
MSLNDKETMAKRDKFKWVMLKHSRLYIDGRKSLDSTEWKEQTG